MTVVAYRDGVMAADTMLSGDGAQYRATKLFRLPDGSVAGGAGDWAKAYAALQWMTQGGDYTKGDGAPALGDSSLLIARPSGELWMVSGEFPAFPLLDTEVAIGCGAEAAKMAMTLGLSAVDAVGRVTKQDVFCGDPVQSMEVEQTHEYSPVVTHKRRRGG